MTGVQFGYKNFEKPGTGFSGTEIGKACKVSTSNDLQESLPGTEKPGTARGIPNTHRARRNSILDIIDKNAGRPVRAYKWIFVDIIDKTVPGFLRARGHVPGKKTVNPHETSKLRVRARKRVPGLDWLCATIRRARPFSLTT